MVVMVEPAGTSLRAVRKPFRRVQINAIILHRSPQALDENIVHPAPVAIHADFHFGRPQHSGEALAIPIIA